MSQSFTQTKFGKSMVSSDHNKSIKDVRANSMAKESYNKGLKAIENREREERSRSEAGLVVYQQKIERV
jgi:hypothetical protein